MCERLNRIKRGEWDGRDLMWLVEQVETLTKANAERDALRAELAQVRGMLAEVVALFNDDIGHYELGAYCWCCSAPNRADTPHSPDCLFERMWAEDTNATPAPTEPATHAQIVADVAHRDDD